MKGGPRNGSTGGTLAAPASLVEPARPRRPALGGRHPPRRPRRPHARDGAHRGHRTGRRRPGRRRHRSAARPRRPRRRGDRGRCRGGTRGPARPRRRRSARAAVREDAGRSRPPRRRSTPPRRRRRVGSAAVSPADHAERITALRQRAGGASGDVADGRRAGPHATTERAHAAGLPGIRPRSHDGLALRQVVAHRGGHVRRTPPPGQRRHRHGLLLGRRIGQRVPATARRAARGVRRRQGRRRARPLPSRRRAAVCAAQRPHVRTLGATHLHRHRLAASRLAGGAPAGDGRAQRGVLRRPVRTPHAQLPRRRGATAPHRRAGRALPLLERRHVP